MERTTTIIEGKEKKEVAIDRVLVSYSQVPLNYIDRSPGTEC